MRYMELEAAIAEVRTNKPFNLVHDERQIRKMMQLKESLDQRMGCGIRARPMHNLALPCRAVPTIIALRPRLDCVARVALLTTNVTPP